MADKKRKFDEEQKESVEITWKTRFKAENAFSSLTNDPGVYIICHNQTPIYVGEAQYGFLKRWKVRLEVFYHANVMTSLSPYYIHCGTTNGPKDASIGEALLTHVVGDLGYLLYNRTNLNQYLTYDDEYQLVHKGNKPKVLTTDLPPTLQPAVVTPTTVATQNFNAATVDGTAPDYKVTLDWELIDTIDNCAMGFPEAPGLYAVVNKKKDTIYIGKAEKEAISKRWSNRLAGFANFGLDVNDVFTGSEVEVFCAAFGGFQGKNKAAIASCERILINYIFKKFSNKVRNADHPSIEAKDNKVEITNLFPVNASLATYLEADISVDDL